MPGPVFNEPLEPPQGPEKVWVVMSGALRTTPLHDLHAALGAQLVDFGGWSMPLWYPSGAVREHLAVLTGAGLFDTSHMTALVAEGEHLRDFLNFALTRELRGLRPGRAAYSLILDARGGAIDDALVYPLPSPAPGRERFALVINAGQGPAVIDHMRKLPGGEGFAWTDLTGRLAKLDLQGPASFRILRSLVAEPERVFAKMPYFSFKGDLDLAATDVRLLDGTPLFISRTGYTGELGFEIFLGAGQAPALWNALLEAGKEDGLIPCGLAARDSLRAGAVLPLSHQDIGPWPFINNPWTSALPLAADGGFTKDFHGRAALDPRAADHTRPFVGFDPRKVEPHEAVVIHEGREVGRVLTAVAEMSLGRIDGRVVGLAGPDRPEGWTPKGLVCGFVKIEADLPAGTEIRLKDARRELKAEICDDIRPGRTARQPLAY